MLTGRLAQRYWKTQPCWSQVWWKPRPENISLLYDLLTRRTGVPFPFFFSNDFLRLVKCWRAASEAGNVRITRPWVALDSTRPSVAVVQINTAFGFCVWMWQKKKTYFDRVQRSRFGLFVSKKLCSFSQVQVCVENSAKGNVSTSEYSLV